MRAARRFLARQDGATAIEYGLIAALVGVALLAGLGGTTNSVGAAFESLMDTVTEILGENT